MVDKTKPDSISLEGHLVKNVGFVKIRKQRNNTDTTWTLLRWKAVQ